jgi:hypothetical protein
MAAINQEAIQALNLVLGILMPDSLRPGVEAITTLSIQSVDPTGIGGFIELNPGGTAYIHGRRIEACYVVILHGNNLDNLQVSAAAVIEAFMGAEKEALLENGILKIVQAGNDYQTLGGANRELKLTFNLIYEYRQLPEETEEVIAEIPVNLSLYPGGD